MRSNRKARRKARLVRFQYIPNTNVVQYPYTALARETLYPFCTANLLSRNVQDYLDSVFYPFVL